MTKKIQGLMAIALLAITTSCSNEDPVATSVSQETQVELVNSSLVTGAYANPLDPILYPDKTAQAIIEQAYNANIAECMTSRGFEPKEGEGMRRTMAPDPQYLYSVTDPAIAAVYGFHPKVWIDGVQKNAGKEGPDPVEPGRDEALYGDPSKIEVKNSDGVVIGSYDPESCVGMANDTLRPDWAEEDYLEAIAWGIMLDVDATGDNEFFKPWSECMAKKGYEYTWPMEANNSFPQDLPTAEEIKTAIASAECQQSSGSLKEWSKYNAIEAQKRLDENPGIVTRWNEIQQSAVDRAKNAQ